MSTSKIEITKRMRKADKAESHAVKTRSTRRRRLTVKEASRMIARAHRAAFKTLEKH